MPSCAISRTRSTPDGCWCSTAACSATGRPRRWSTARPPRRGSYATARCRSRSCAGRWDCWLPDRARLLTREIVEQANLILTMARHHRARVDELGGEGRVFVLGEYGGREGEEAEVSDPFGGDLEVYRDTVAELEALVDATVERMVKEGQRGDRR